MNPIKVFKFGGASVKDAAAVRNVSQILKTYLERGDKLVVVVSAMGKTTNHLEDLFHAARKGQPQVYKQVLKELEAYHQQIALDLFEGNEEAVIFRTLKKYFFQLEATLEEQEPIWDKHYDQIICFGELISTAIVAEYLKTVYNDKCLWVDARRFVQTNERWREGQVDWEWSEQLIKSELLPILDVRFILTQGFLGGTIGGKTTTLGREGSDFTAAIFAYCLQAESVTIWKDVAGILNADPKRIKSTRLFTHINYSDAAEMTYYGATVIHPKTIRPLAAKNIPLYVRSFINYDQEGTVIGNFPTQPALPAIIVKGNQTLCTFQQRDLASINEKNTLAYIHNELARFNLKINLLQTSATAFYVCLDTDERKLEALQASMGSQLDFTLESNLELITVKNYDAEMLQNFTNLGNAVFVQRGGKDFQVVVRK
ncbi:aspartate kinase [Hugenholtzia roseola]|uniref:aspartate kinase n=1 Tax=Hugenholtzia roseola TaxID=1002 RepID=UPI0004119649|nr:aspartate kinase [Hugenholtzia roseola]